MKFAATIIALSSVVFAARDSEDVGGTVSFAGSDFATQGAALKTALAAKNSDGAGSWYLNYYNFGMGFDQNRQIFAYYPQEEITGGNDDNDDSDDICIGIVDGISAGAPNGKNGGCDSVWGNGCSQVIVEAIRSGCSNVMFSGIPQECGILNVEVMNVSTGTFTPANPAVWITWDYSTNSSSEENTARSLTYPVFARSSDGTANLACLRVDGGAATIGASVASMFVVAGSALYMLL